MSQRHVIERCTKERPKNGRTYGYTVRDTRPKMQTHEDIEGVGYVRITPRPILYVSWARRKADAQARADFLNKSA